MKTGDDAKEEAPPPPPPPPPPEEKKEEPPPKEEKKAEKVKAGGPEIKGDSIVLPGAIVFDTGKATLKAGSGSEEILSALKEFLVEKKRVTLLRIEGNTDNVGKPEDNLKLAGERALTIKTWLIDHGIDKDRLVAVGFGEDKPVADNATDEGRGKNRRTEFRIAKLDGKAYMGNKPLGGGKEFK
jgi:OOP family OmpA-OmpF porin